MRNGGFHSHCELSSSRCTSSSSSSCHHLFSRRSQSNLRERAQSLLFRHDGHRSTRHLLNRFILILPLRRPPSLQSPSLDASLRFELLVVAASHRSRNASLATRAEHSTKSVHHRFLALHARCVYDVFGRNRLLDPRLRALSRVADTQHLLCDRTREYLVWIEGGSD